MNVLLLDTNVSSYPIYESLVEKGYTVFVAGSNPDDCLALSAKYYLEFDYSDFKLLIQFTKENNIDLVLPGCNDLSYKIAAKYNQYFNCGLNLEKEDIDDLINQKHLFKEFAIKIGLNVPHKIQVWDLNEYSNYPIIIKPTDSFSGKGVTVLKEFNKRKIEEAIENAKLNSKSNTFFAEEFIDGQLFSHSAFIHGRDIKLDFVVEEYCNFYPFAVDKSWVVKNKQCPFLEVIRNEIKKIIRALDLKQGLIHTQFIYSKGEVKILEITRRCPGDLYSKLIEYSTGINYSLIYINLILNNDVDFKQPIKNINIIRETIHKKNIPHYSINLEKYSSIIEFVPIVKTGFLTKSNLSRVGIVFYINN
ncbi:MAG: ATP-grasp domain-containing protein [Bacteroidia bacterium]|nr:ATP-grasp domain-containing protein [Bacteroidia bacterium]